MFEHSRCVFGLAKPLSRPSGSPSVGPMARGRFYAPIRGFLTLSNGIALLCLILGAWLLCVGSLRRPQIGDFMDDGEYFVAAQSIRDGHGYRLPSRPSSPPEAKYPPGLSLITAGLLPAKGSTLEADFRAARAVATLAAVVFAVASFCTLRLLGVSGLVAACCVGPALWNDMFLNESLSLLSDIPYAACCTLAALVWALLRSGKAKPTAVVALALGIVSGASVALRSNGVALLMAFLVLAWEASRRWRFAGVYLSAASLLLMLVRAVTKAGASVAPSEPYSVNWVAYSSMKTAVTIPLTNLVSYAKAIPALLVPELNANVLSRQTALTTGIRIVVWLAILRGAWTVRRNVRSIDAAPISFALLTGTICLVWPWSLSLRPVVPFMPFLVATAILGVPPKPRWRFSSASVASAGVLVLVAVQSAMTVRSIRLASHALDQALEFLRERTEANAVIVTQLPETAYLYTGRQAVKLLNDSDAISHNLGKWDSINAWEHVAKDRPFYVLGPPYTKGNDGIIERHLAGLVANAPGRLQELYRTKSGEWAVFRVIT